MDRAEIERIIEEAGAKARGEKRGGSKFNRQKVRGMLNTLFLIIALVGLAVYLFGYNVVGLVIIGVGMIFKVAEFFIRFFL